MMVAQLLIGRQENEAIQILGYYRSIISGEFGYFLDYNVSQVQERATNTSWQVCGATNALTDNPPFSKIRTQSPVSGRKRTEHCCMRKGFAYQVPSIRAWKGLLNQAKSIEESSAAYSRSAEATLINLFKMKTSWWPLRAKESYPLAARLHFQADTQKKPHRSDPVRKDAKKETCKASKGPQNGFLVSQIHETDRAGSLQESYECRPARLKHSFLSNWSFICREAPKTDESSHQPETPPRRCSFQESSFP